MSSSWISRSHGAPAMPSGASSSRGTARFRACDPTGLVIGAIRGARSPWSCWPITSSTWAGSGSLLPVYRCVTAVPASEVPHSLLRDLTLGHKLELLDAAAARVGEPAAGLVAPGRAQWCFGSHGRFEDARRRIAEVRSDARRRRAALHRRGLCVSRGLDRGRRGWAIRYGVTISTVSRQSAAIVAALRPIRRAILLTIGLTELPSSRFTASSSAILDSNAGDAGILGLGLDELCLQRAAAFIHVLELDDPAVAVLDGRQLLIPQSSHGEARLRESGSPPRRARATARWRPQRPCSSRGRAPSR